MSSKKKTVTKKLPLSTITAETFKQLKELWKQYRDELRTVASTRLQLGKELFDLQAKHAEPKTGDFVNLILTKVGIPVTTVYRLILNFKRVKGVVDLNENIQKAASEQYVDLSSPTKTMTSALQKHAKDFKKAENLTEVRKVMEKVAAFKLPEVVIVKRTEEAIAKQQLKAAAVKYLGFFKGKARVERWNDLCREVEGEFSEFDDLATAAKAQPDLVNVPAHTFPSTDNFTKAAKSKTAKSTAQLALKAQPVTEQPAQVQPGAPSFAAEEGGR
jgi:hypothetical protein